MSADIRCKRQHDLKFAEPAPRRRDSQYFFGDNPGHDKTFNGAAPRRVRLVKLRH